VVVFGIPFAGATLHGLTAELATGSSPLATRAGFRAVLGSRVAANLLGVSDAHMWAGSFFAPSSADIRRMLVRLWTVCDSGRWDHMGHDAPTP
jgi:hypothetical protein